MNRNRGYYRKQRYKKIKKRLKLISILERNNSSKTIVSGKLADGGFGFLSWGTSIKYNRKKGHSSYRHKSAYGKANSYKKHDAIQIEDMNYQLEEYINNGGDSN